MMKSYIVLFAIALALSISANAQESTITAIKAVSESSTWKDYALPIMGVITAATAITSLTPTKSDDKIINAILGLLNFLAGNFFKNKNKDA